MCIHICVKIGHKFKCKTTYGISPAMHPWSTVFQYFIIDFQIHGIIIVLSDSTLKRIDIENTCY